MIAAATLGAPFPTFRLHPEVDLVFLVPICVWWWAHKRLALRLAPDPAHPSTARDKRLFFTGLILLWAFASWPVHDVGEQYLFWVHMVQHTVFAYIAPPLLLLGLPPWLRAWLAQLPVLRTLCRRLARPIPAALLFNTLTLVLHDEWVVNTATQSAPLHFGVHLLLFTSAMCFWFPVVNKDIRFPHLGPAAKLLFMMFNTTVPILPAVFLALATKPTYAHYANAPRLAAIRMSPLADQQTAAGIMWGLSSTWMLGVVICVFLDWYRSEQADERTASLPEHIRHRKVAALS